MTQAHQQKKNLFIKTWGCQMNVYDSNRMADILKPFGYETVDQPEGADMIILNTCHIREKATEKVFSEIGRLKQFKDKKKDAGEDMILAVAGCVGQAEGDEITKRAPAVDLVFGPQTYHELPEMMANLTDAYGNKRVVNTEFPVESKFDFLPEENSNAEAVAFLSIQEGCDKFCTFCVVPYTRGAEFSRPAQQILDEARVLTKAGSKEIHLLGQNVNAYHGEGPDGKEWGLGRLIQAVAEIEGVERIRYTTSHPRDVDDELIEAHRNVGKIMPYLHLPVQSGSNKILKAMNRKHDRDEYFKLIDRFRDAHPDLVFSSDFIVGFPGESEQDFEDTMDLVRRVNYAQAYSFKYSARPGTPAANMQGLLSEKVKGERLQRLQDLLNEQQMAFNQTCLERTIPVLFERKGKKDGQIIGRSPYMQSVSAFGNERLIGQIIDVKINHAAPNSLSGDIELGEFSSTRNVA